MSLKREVVCLSSDPKWLDYRYDLVTASEIVALFPEYAYKAQTRGKLIELKRTKNDIFQGNELTWWGSHLESSIVRAYAEITQARTRGINILLKRGRIGATLDGLCLPPRISETKHIATNRHIRSFLLEARELPQKTGILEIKNRKMGDPDEIPSYHWVQVQTQLYVTGYPYAIYCPKIGACGIYPKVVLPDYEFMAKLEPAVEEFWKEVKCG